MIYKKEEIKYKVKKKKPVFPRMDERTECYVDLRSKEKCVKDSFKDCEQPHVLNNSNNGKLCLVIRSIR